MPDVDSTDVSWAWLFGLLGFSAAVMATWFYFYPRVAILSTLVGVLFCLIGLSGSQQEPAEEDFYAERREP